jgi:hypothetical protein
MAGCIPQYSVLKVPFPRILVDLQKAKVCFHMLHVILSRPFLQRVHPVDIDHGLQYNQEHKKLVWKWPMANSLVEESGAVTTGG